MKKEMEYLFGLLLMIILSFIIFLCVIFCAIFIDPFRTLFCFIKNKLNKKDKICGFKEVCFEKDKNNYFGSVICKNLEENYLIGNRCMKYNKPVRIYVSYTEHKKLKKGK